MSALGLLAVILVGVLSFVALYLVLDRVIVRLAHVGVRVLRRPRPSFDISSLPWSDRARDRECKAAIQRSMPTFLDIVTLGLSAGLSFDASLELYCTRFDTPLASMLSEALQLWRMGVKSRSEALEDLAAGVHVPAMTRFASTVTESLAFGTPLSETLERQAQVIRNEQHSQKEEEIERVPVKMIVPLCALIVPAMLLSILGPLLGPALSSM